jgi:N-acetyltransferase
MINACHHHTNADRSSSTRLDTPLGIHRLFTIPTYRSLGLAQILLDAACAHTVYGCQFDPLHGQVAFSQPTSSGRAVMEKWGKGGVRVFVDDESQL